MFFMYIWVASIIYFQQGILTISKKNQFEIKNVTFLQRYNIQKDDETRTLGQR